MVTKILHKLQCEFVGEPEEIARRATAHWKERSILHWGMSLVLLRFASLGRKISEKGGNSNFLVYEVFWV